MVGRLGHEETEREEMWLADLAPPRTGRHRCASPRKIERDWSPPHRPTPLHLAHGRIERGEGREGKRKG